MLPSSKDLFIKVLNQNSSKVTTVLVRIFMNKSLTQVARFLILEPQKCETALLYQYFCILDWLVSYLVAGKMRSLKVKMFTINQHFLTSKVCPHHFSMNVSLCRLDNKRAQFWYLPFKLLKEARVWQRQVGIFCCMYCC